MNNKPKIKVLIADDKRLIREALKNVFQTDPAMVVVAEACSGDEVTDQLREHPADIVVLDISMPGKNGLEVLGELKRDFPKLPVLILSMHNDAHFKMLAKQKGAAAYLTKGESPEKLLSTIHRISEQRKIA